MRAPSSEVAARSTITAATPLTSAALGVASALEVVVVWHHHRRRALLPRSLSLFLLAAPQLGHRPLLLPLQQRHQRLAQPLLRHLFRPMSVPTDGVEQMGVARLVRAVLSGDAVRAMDGVAMGRMTTVDCRGVASRSSGHAASKSSP